MLKIKVIDVTECPEKLQNIISNHNEKLLLRIEHKTTITGKNKEFAVFKAYFNKDNVFSVITYFADIDVELVDVISTGDICGLLNASDMLRESVKSELKKIDESWRVHALQKINHRRGACRRSSNRKRV